MSTATIRGHKVPTDYAGGSIPGLEHLPREHTFVSTTNGETWGCFGRDLQDEPAAEITGQGEVTIEWVRAIAGADGSAGLVFQTSGVCQQCANRLLLPAGLDVSDSKGNEIATVVFGKYGLDPEQYIERLKTAAAQVNASAPGLIPDSVLNTAVSKVENRLKDERDSLVLDIKRIFGVSIPEQPSAIRSGLTTIYEGLNATRTATYAALTSGELSNDEFKDRMIENIKDAIHKVRELIGEAAFDQLTAAPPPLAASFIVNSAFQNVV